jgi:two-component system LytT family sensor kinase
MNKSGLPRTLSFCLIITAIVAAGLTYTDPVHWFEYLYSAFIFTTSIGFVIHGLVTFSLPRISKFPTILRLSLLLILFLVGGFVGTEVGILIQGLVSDAKVPIPVHIRLLSFNLVLSAIFGSIAVLYFTLRARAEFMAAKLQEKELNEERLTRLKTKAELEALQAKINPHFLFNTLNSIASLISENPKAAEETVEKLSELFRYTLRYTEKNTATVAEELDLVRTYLEIEKLRLGDRLQFEVKCEDAVREVGLPPMLIQPLVENSIKHGIASAIEGGTILVEAKAAGGNCVIAVHDSGKGFQNEGDAEGFGLRSIQERLRLRYGEKASLQVVQNSHTQIIICIPLA